MSIKIIGAGFGRTGTLSVKLALEELGFGPCYHMNEVFTHTKHAEFWHGAALGEPTDWSGFLAPYGAVVDWPACHFWRELMHVYEDARVLLTERDPETWYRSISQTIFEAMARFRADPVPDARARMATFIVWERTFGRRTDRERVIQIYKAHNEAVKRSVPAERLLVYNVAQGWAPLAEFLGVATPDTPFPCVNTTKEFLDHGPSRSDTAH